MRIGIIVIATGKYPVYLDRLLPSLHERFLPQHDRTIFCLTDSERNLPVPVVKAFWPHRGWPYNTLFKFKAINSIAHLYENMDVLFYIDADMEVVAVVDNEAELMPESGQPVCCVLHCGWLDSAGRPEIRDPYEHNPRSLACVNDTRGVPYHQACFFGGYREPLLEMTRHLERNIDVDLEQGIVAVWHDESHLNRWFVDHPPKTIPRTYARPLAMGELLPGTKIVAVLKDNETMR